MLTTIIYFLKLIESKQSGLQSFDHNLKSLKIYNNEFNNLGSKSTTVLYPYYYLTMVDGSTDNMDTVVYLNYEESDRISPAGRL